MSSEKDQDDLEERKDEVWSMDEVRGSGGTAVTDTIDASASGDISDTVKSNDTSDASDTSDTNDTIDEESPSTESDVEGTPDAKAASEPPDTEDTPGIADTSVKHEAGPTAQTEGETVRQMALDAENKELAVRDLHNVNVYLFESVYHDMQTKFKQLDTEYYAAHGEDLSKNKDFFNAVFRAGLQSPQLKEELEIE